MTRDADNSNIYHWRIRGKFDVNKTHQ